jgi:CubicO group peptidase (beta-lactamase class C family)
LRLRAAALFRIMALCLFLLYPSCQDTTPPEQTTPEKSFDALFPDLMAKWGIPGGAVAVVKDDRLVFAKGYGKTDTESGAPPTPSSLFRIASLSKPLTSAAILRLREQGRLGLEDKVFRKYLVPAPPPGTAMDPRLLEVTVRRLLEHSGGWDRDASFDPMFRSKEISAALGKPGPASAADIVRYMTGRRLDFIPGARYAYSNFGYCILGRVIEKVTGKSYFEAMKELVLDPAGISGMRLGRTRLANRAGGEVRYYDYLGAPLAPSVFPGDEEPVPWPYGGFFLEAMDSHGAWLASATDLMRFLAVCDGRAGRADILSPSTLQDMIARPDLPDWQNASYYYGLGWSVRPVGNDANWWHTGSLPGTISIIVRASNGLSWVGLFNSRPADADGFATELDETFWKAVDGVTEWPATDLFTTSASSTAGLSGVADGFGLRLESPADELGSGNGAPQEASASTGDRGRDAVLAGVLLSVDGRRSLAVVGGPAGKARNIGVGEVFAGFEVLEISEKGMIMTRNGRTVFVPVGGSILMKNKNGGR